MSKWSRMQLWCRRLGRSLRGLVTRHSSLVTDSDMDEELRAHIDSRTRQNIESGMPPEEARHAALRQFGWTESIKEDCRDQRGIGWIDNLVQDVRHGTRMLAKHRGFTTVAVLTLALGIGVNTSVFSVMNAILFRALPYPAPEQLTRVYRASPHSDHQSHSVPDFLDYQAQQTVFEDMAGFATMDCDFNEPGQPAERLRSMLVSASFLPLLRVQPALGRAFTPDEDRHNPDVVILSHDFWVSRFGADPAVVGRTLQLNRTPATVVGVLPPGFDYPLLWGQVDIWRPIGFPPGMRMNANRGNAWFQVVARLKTGVSLNQARAEMNTIATRLAQDHPATNARGGLRVLPLRASTGDEPSRRVTGLTMGLAAFVLLIACANLANLQFARASGRAREYAIRAALGAGRGRLTRQLLTESLLLAVLGGALGIGLAAACNQVLGRQIVVAGQAGLTVALDPLVLGFALVVSVLTGVVFGVVPAWTAARAGVNSGLRECARGSTTARSGNRLRHALIVAEVALALVLLTGAGLFLRGLERFTHRHPGWNVDGLLTAHITLPNSIYARNGRRGAFCERLREQLKDLPGVENAALSWSVPVGSHSSSRRVAIDGQPEPPPGLAPVASYQGVSPGYFETLGMRLRAGRDFAAQDGTSNASPVVIINEAMARAFWPNESALGKRIAFEHPQVGYQRGMEVIGVVNDIVLAANLAPPETRFQAYRPLAREESAHVAVTLRSATRPEVLADGLRRAVAGLDAQQPVHEIITARQAAGRLLANYSLLGWLLGGFALLGLLLAALGIHGVIAGFVAERTNEFGVRFALGAQMRDILRLVLGLGLRLGLAGLLIGLAGAAGVARLLQALIPELPAHDPALLAATVLILLATAALAGWLPARRASRVDPMVALRHE